MVFTTIVTYDYRLGFTAVDGSEIPNNHLRYINLGHNGKIVPTSSAVVPNEDIFPAIGKSVDLRASFPLTGSLILGLVSHLLTKALSFFFRFFAEN